MDSLSLSPLQQCDGSSVEWLKPFDEGWQREIVLRNTSQNSSLKKSDVYYYTPDNKKLRSIPEIEAFLQNADGSSLSINCFTFKKERIHTDPSEIVRQAAATRGRTRGGTNSTPSLDDVATCASTSTTASGSSPTVAEEAPLEAHTSSVTVNVIKGCLSRARRKHPRSSASVTTRPAKQPRIKKAPQLPDDLCAKLCSVYCFGRKWPIWPLDVFCGNCSYGFHFVCIGKSCFTADYICMKCAPKTEADVNFSDNKDVTKVATGLIHNVCEQSSSPKVISSTPKKPHILRKKSSPCVYTSRISNCERLSKNSFCLGSLPTSLPFCNFNSEKSVLIPNKIQVKSTENKTVKEILFPESRSLTATETTQTADCNVSYYHLAYDSLERVFKYLSVADLLNCRLVCKTWNNIASQPSLWSCKFYESPDRLQNLNSRQKNLRTGNVHEDYVDAFARIPPLNRVNLGRCQCTVVEIVIDGNRDMRLFSAELFMDNRKEAAEDQWPDDVLLDFKVFSGMDQLEILRLRAIGKLIPIDVDLISRLTSLRTLSLTSLYQVPGSDLLSIFTLPKLKVLELGDCYQWDQEVFKKLGELRHVEILKLEVREEEDDSGFGAALLKLKNLKRLELSRYSFGCELSNILPQVTHLRQMCIWTELLDDKMKTARLFKHLVTGVQEMAFLQSLYLGIIAPAANDGFNCNFDIPIFTENGSDYESTDMHRIYSRLQCKLKNTKIMVQAIPLFSLQSVVK